ncbi:MAG: hypothetical protein OXI43_02445 [Candidatus Poribacteria bacterium]|nr:hypothetical protein [Candidatus Poribacteria bacterium]
MTKFLPFLLIISMIMGCAGYNFEKVEVNLKTGKPEDAYNHLKKNAPKKPDIPHQFELGLTAHYANLFPESSKAFEQAEMIAEDRFTKSISKEALSLVTTDKLRPYAGTRYERLLSHYYHALNYIYLNKLDDALVECRRATNLIQYFKGEDNEYNYFGTGFLAHFCGMVFEAAGEWNDALISYRQAEEYYKNAAALTGVPVPDDVGQSLVRLTRKLNFTDEFERYRTQYGEPSPRPENYGELILFFETGYVPRKQEESLTFPILKTDKFSADDDKDSVKFARTLRTREGLVVEEVKLEYLLHVAMPVIRSNRPHFAGIQVSVGEDMARGVLIEDVETMAIETLKAERTVILIRTLARALGKYLIFRKAKKENKVLGAVVNLAGVLTESADTRSWQTLPNQIFMVRMPLPTGTHTLKLSFLNSREQISRSEFVQDVKISSNQITFFNYRTYE